MLFEPSEDLVLIHDAAFQEPAREPPDRWPIGRHDLIRDVEQVTEGGHRIRGPM